MHIFNILTLFPEFFKSPLDVSILKRAIENKIIKVNVLDIREYSLDKHRKCDDYPYGGGDGMVMTPQPIYDAVRSIKKKYQTAKTIVFSAKGKPLSQEFIKEIKNFRRFILIAGHYEGIDERIIDHYADYEVSIGDYILTGGEYGALIFIDALTRLLNGALLNQNSIKEESFEDNLLEYDQFTRPRIFRGYSVPEVLLSGDHAKIKKWRFENRIKNTKKNRLDLFLKRSHEK